MAEDKSQDPTEGKPTHADAKRLDEAHRTAGDGTLQGSVPAGLTVEELRRRAEGKVQGPDGTAASD
jgi:hypothetical protein